ncbi:mucin-associated surface protein (MASP), putative [Trypanosoma cruzi marinkellei]|uniref:Mucin-associated surface protein (MASP), putative n=1 Tax=Trypanosoma cruzi marinkellei TaxID=85056 RepID=K2M3K8_TRYCR|nr:mucin-associated surface protein (MASP), putative [Trypanosoma cruzi marinkellei]
MVAMMMTGRVLLVCALCVLWCGAACGFHARDVDNTALGGCLASGEFGENTLYMGRGCNKTVPVPPLRSVFPISALNADAAADEEDVTVADGDDSNLSTVSGDDGSSPGGGAALSLSSEASNVSKPTGATSTSQKNNVPENEEHSERQPASELAMSNLQAAKVSVLKTDPLSTSTEYAAENQVSGGGVADAGEKRSQVGREKFSRDLQSSVQAATEVKQAPPEQKNWS